MEISKERVERAFSAFMPHWHCGNANDAMKAALTADAAYQSDIVGKLADALEALGEMNLVQGDVAKIKEPHANYNLNSNAAWITCAAGKSAHKVRDIIGNCREALKLVGRS